MPADGSGDLRGALDSKTNVSIVVSKSNECLKTGTLTCTTLLLNRHDLHNLILKLILQEVINDLSLLDWKREEEDLLDRLDLTLLHETAELGDWGPASFFSSITAATASTATSPAATTAASESSSSSFSWLFVRHIFWMGYKS